jgi:diguanylate cyclase
LDWSKLPDLGAVALFASAFAAVARQSQIPSSGLWLAGWVMVALHFAAFMFATLAGVSGLLATFVALGALAGAGMLFIWSSIPYREQPSSKGMVLGLLVASTLYIGLLVLAPGAVWGLTLAALLFGVLPLGIALYAIPQFHHPMRWVSVVLYCALSVFLVAFQNRPNTGHSMALNALFFTVYLACGIHFWYAHRRPSTGAFIVFAGFLAWASRFAAAPGVNILFPSVRLESEAWNLPMYMVAMGMILLLLEDQIEHNKHLALHDELTGLPNRRLFQDRLMNALERARRSGSEAALLLVDLDYFKQVNDTAGHHVGDLLLKRISDIFSGRVRRTDTVARTGGDEFSIILEEPTSLVDAEQVAHSLIQLLDRPIELEGHRLRVGASIGIAVFPGDGSNADTLRIAADRHMYAVKRTTRAQAFGGPPTSRLSRAVPAAEAPTGS